MDGHLTWVVARVTCLSKNKQMQYKKTQSNAQKGLRQGIQGNKQIVIKFRKKKQMQYRKKTRKCSNRTGNTEKPANAKIVIKLGETKTRK